MDPGIYYLYEYENKQRRRNTGFIRSERYFSTCRLQINARGIPAGNGSQLILYAFFRDDDNIHMTGSQIGTLNCFRKNISMHIHVNESEFPEHRPLDQIDGFLILMPTENSTLCWAACETFFDLDPRMMHSSPKNTGSAPKEDKEIAASENKVSKHETESSTVSSPEVRKIRQEEIKNLPKRFWTLSSNSFLLHGYHNYSHLILFEEKGRLWLGVPGIFDKREARAADLFGFPRFTSSYAAVLNLDENERSADKNFGHWCRCVGPVLSSAGSDFSAPSTQGEEASDQSVHFLI